MATLRFPIASERYAGNEIVPQVWVMEVLKSKNLIFILLAASAGLSQCKRKSPPSRVALDPSEQIIPPTPQKVSAVPGNLRVEIKWNKVAAATSYNIYWSLKKDFTKNKATAIERHLSTNLVHRFLVNDVSYYYRVSAIGPGGESPLSKVVHAKPTATDQSYDATGEYLSRNPTISANGDAIVFVAKCRDGSCLLHAQKKSNVWSKPKVISEIGFKATNEGPFPSISADGNTVVYQQKRGIIMAKFVGNVWEESKISDHSQGLRTSMSDDGTRVVWSENGTLYASIYIVAWTTPVAINAAKSFHMSGDGQFIAFENAGIKLASYQSDNWVESAVAAGESPRISYDGSHISALDSDSVKIFKKTAGTWNSQERQFPECCAATAPLSGDALTLVQGLYFSEYKSSNWTAAKHYSDGAFNPEIDHGGDSIVYSYDDDIFVVKRKTDQTWGSPIKID